MLRCPFLFTFIILNVISQIYAEDNLNCVVSIPINKTNLNIIVIPSMNNNGSMFHQYFQDILQISLMENGNTIIERTQFNAIISELTLDQSGIVKEGKAESNIADPSNKSNLKRIGEILGSDAILFFSAWKQDAKDTKYEDNNYFDLKIATFRLVDCQTSRLILAGTVMEPNVIDATRLISFAIQNAKNNVRLITGNESKSKGLPDSYSFVKNIDGRYYKLSTK